MVPENGKLNGFTTDNDEINDTFIISVLAGLLKSSPQIESLAM
jgi:hypothetical protein